MLTVDRRIRLTDSTPTEGRVAPWYSGGRQLSMVLALLVAVYAPTISWLVDRWTMSVWHHAHGFLIPPIVAWFVVRELKLLRHLPPSTSALGFAIVVPALALHALDAAIHTQLLSAVSFVLLMPGLALLFLGRARTKAILFPLAFLAFMLPIPLAFTESLHLALRQVVTAAVAATLSWFGMPLYVEGTIIHLAAGEVVVADACSGFSTLYAAIAVACLTAYASESWKRRTAVLLAAAPIAIGSNILRVMFLTVIVAEGHYALLDTWVHPASGLMTFALALPLILWIGQSPGSTHRARDLES